MRHRRLLDYPLLGLATSERVLDDFGALPQSNIPLDDGGGIIEV